MAEDTVVFFLSDNGGVTSADTGERPTASNAPLRGGKSELFEGGVRVPFAMRWPRRFVGGKDYTRPISTMDMFATLAAEIGVPLRADRPLDGVDLVPYREGTKAGDPQAVLFWCRFDQGQRAIVAGDLKYVDNGQGKLLFNLRTDNAERANIAAANAKNVEQLDKVWSIWNAQMAKEPAFPPLGTWPRQGGETKKPAPRKPSQHRSEGAK